ncbi:MAG: hypothetical protein JNM65_03120 [Verrucomicrobiaceae bacterium]|nr:hypothetical protein [Verrucomicrobiaceae bacterium]
MCKAADKKMRIDDGDWPARPSGVLEITELRHQPQETPSPSRMPRPA